ncbi:MAG: redoxin family protein [Gemmatimonadota bacterium]|jgi:tetratricopeptide (TPR) repeat protein
MRNRIRRTLKAASAPLLCLFLGLLMLSPSSLHGRQDAEQQSAEQAAQAQRELYYDRAWELGTIHGEEWCQPDPLPAELCAWYALNLARNGAVDEALETADALLVQDPENPWAWFAFAGSVLRHRERSAEALEASEKALSLNPDDLDFLSLHADIVRLQEGEDEAIDFIDSLPPEQGGHPLVAIRKAVALHGMASRDRDVEKEAEAFEFFREVMAKDTTFLEPMFFLGTRLQTAGEVEEGTALIERSAALSLSHEVHRYVWRGIQARRDLSAEEKLQLVEEDVDELFKNGGRTPGALLAVATIYEQAQETERRDSLWTEVLTHYPESLSAEWVLVYRYRALQGTIYEQERAGEEPDPELKVQYRRQIEEYLMKPVHHRETLRGDAYRSLLYLLREEEVVDPEFLYSVVRGVELYEGINLHIIHAMAPILLAEHGSHLDYAESLARAGIEKSRKEIEEVKERGGIFEREEEFQTAANRAEATMLDAVGWVLFHKGEIEDAEAELLRAYQLNEADPSILHHLGRLYQERSSMAVEADADLAESFLDQAQEFFLKGTMVQTPAENPNDEALKALFLERHGSMDAFEEFLAGASETDSDTRKAKIFAERIEEPELMAQFHLETLLGDSMASQSLDGKVTVINFWGTWCGPCVLEMPGIQELSEKYENDDRVVVLTLSNDENPDVIHRFMEKEEFNFPVLLDDGYVREVGVSAFPTTWFVGPDGRIHFKKRGWSEDLVQEFTWRIEAILGGVDP